MVVDATVVEYATPLARRVVLPTGPFGKIQEGFIPFASPITVLPTVALGFKLNNILHLEQYWYIQMREREYNHRTLK